MSTASASARRRGLALRAIDLYSRVADSTLLDRLVRGRVWIGLLAFALIGIVAMQLMVLKLNAGIGATLAREGSLQRENAQLGIEAATAAGEGRVEPLAAAGGMTFAAPGSVHFVTASPADVSQAAAALAQPIQPREGTSATLGEATVGESASTGETATGQSASPGETATGQSASPGETATGLGASTGSAPAPRAGEQTETGHG